MNKIGLNDRSFGLFVNDVDSASKKNNEKTKTNPLHFTFQASLPSNKTAVAKVYKKVPETLLHLKKVVGFHKQFLQFYHISDQTKQLVTKEGNRVCQMTSDSLFAIISKFIRKQSQLIQTCDISNIDGSYFGFFENENIEIVHINELVKVDMESDTMKATALHNGSEVTVKMSKVGHVFQSAIATEYDILCDINSYGPVLGIMEKPFRLLKLSNRTVFFGRKYETNYAKLTQHRFKHFQDKKMVEEVLVDFLQVFFGLKILVDNNLFHSSITLENLQIRHLKNGMRVVALGDFSASFSQRIHERRSFAAKTIRCVSQNTPESELVLLKKLQRVDGRDGFYEVAKKIDAFALGCALYTALANRHPFDLKNNGHPSFATIDFKPLEYVPNEMVYIVKGLLEENSKKRLDISEAYEMWNKFFVTYYPKASNKFINSVKRNFYYPHITQVNRPTYLYIEENNEGSVAPLEMRRHSALHI